MTGVDLQSVTVNNIERVTHRPVVTNRQAMAGVGLQTISDSDVQRVTHRQAVTGVDLQSVTGHGYTARVSWLYSTWVMAIQHVGTCWAVQRS